MRDDEYRRHTELEGGRRALRQDSPTGHTRIQNKYMLELESNHFDSQNHPMNNPPSYGRGNT